MAGCQKCNSCQHNTCSSCNSCQSCNSGCQSCNSCQGSCQSSQSFCSTGGQTVGSFNFNQCISKGETFLTKTNWNRLITYINNAFSRGSKQNGGSSGLPSKDTNTFMTADIFNKVAAALGKLGSSGPSRRVSVNSVVYGSYFEDLENYADNLKYKTNQCNRCNVSCNEDCLGCQKCDSGCQSCNKSNCGKCNGSCQSNNPSSCCSKCNVGCESHTASKT